MTTPENKNEADAGQSELIGLGVEQARYRDGVERWTVCDCGMQMVEGKTCSVCGYKCENPNIRED